MPLLASIHNREEHKIPDTPGAIEITHTSNSENDKQSEPTPKPGQIIRRNSKDFIFHKIIGEGSFSTVYMGQDVHTLKNYAVKVMDKRHILRLRKQACVKREKEVLQTLNANPHPFFVKLYCTFQDSERLFIVLSYAKNGEILNYINRTNGFDLETSRFYAAELVVALEHLHRMNVIHRDLKPENILLDWDMHIKITDFGSATFFNNRLPSHTPSPPPTTTATTTPDTNHRLAPTDGEIHSEPPPATSHNKSPAGNQTSATATSTPNARGSSFVGTAQYVSPEVLTSKQISYGSDLWALGCVLYQFLTGQYPFKANNEYHIFQKIINLNYTFPPDINPDAEDLIRNLIKIDPILRLGSLETGGYKALRAHPFFQEPAIQPLEEIYHKTAPLALKYPSEVRCQSPPTPISEPKTTDNSMALVEYNGYKIRPGLDDGQLNRLHGLGMLLHESFSELSILGSQTSPEMVDTIPSINGAFQPNLEHPLYVINAESSSSKNSSNTAMSSGDGIGAGNEKSQSLFSDIVDKKQSHKSKKYSTLPTFGISIISDLRSKSNEEPLENKPETTDGGKRAKFLGLGKRKPSKKKSLLIFPSTRSGTNFDKEDRRKYSLPITRKKRVNTGPANFTQGEMSCEEDCTNTTPSSQNYEQFTGGRKILKLGLVDKRVGLFSRRRMLLLTEGPHLYYIDPVGMVLKGEIPWSQNLKTEVKTFKVFHVHTPKRTYYLEDPEGYALKWCDAISQIHKQTYGQDCECNEICLDPKNLLTNNSSHPKPAAEASDENSFPSLDILKANDHNN